MQCISISIEDRFDLEVELEVRKSWLQLIDFGLFYGRGWLCLGFHGFWDVFFTLKDIIISGFADFKFLYKNLVDYIFLRVYGD